MRTKAKTKPILILIALLLIINISLPCPLDAYLTPEEEADLGEQFLHSIRSQYEFTDYPYLVHYINDLGAYIGRQIEVSYFPLNFYVVRENIINAFAAPAGHIFVFSGLAIMLDDVDELACILAHELGHVSARHLAQRIERSKKIGMATMAGVLAGILVGGKAAGPLVTGSIAAGIQAELSYSREDERQADQIGSKYADISGFNPNGMISALKKIQRGQWYGSEQTPSYLQTHPGAPERMANIAASLQGHEKGPEPEKTKQLRSQFPLFHAMVMALCMDKEDALREFNERLRADPKSAMAHYGLGLALEREGNTAAALDHFESALSGKPDSIPIMFSMGRAYHNDGQYEKSLSILQRALELDPHDKEVLYLSALSLQRLERYSQATKIYERLSFLPPVKNEVYYNLGVVYGNQGSLTLAHYNLGIYFSKLRKGDRALFHFKKAEELAEQDPALREKIHQALRDLKKYHPSK
jgi:predicted Zn-dependent protease